MGKYWKLVFKTAWTDTRQSFGWNQKTVATTLLVLAGLIPVLLQLGLVAMIASATGIFWTASPFVIAGLILFAWNFFSAQAKLYTELTDKIAELETALARAEEPPPDYVAWRHVGELSLRQAAFLWCDLEPRVSRPPKVTAWLNALMSAVKNKELGIIVDYSSSFGHASAMDVQRDLQIANPHPETKTTRSALQRWAKKHDHDPTFLRDV